MSFGVPQSGWLNPAMQKLRDQIDSLEPTFQSLLQKLIAFKSMSGHEGPLVRFVAEWAQSAGFDIDIWQADDDALAAQYPSARVRHLPLANRPTLVIRSPGTSNGPSLLFNAHSDVVPVPDAAQWQDSPWSGTFRDGRIYGRGACDDLGPLVCGLWSMTAISRSLGRLPGDLALELVPGEEDCVAIGTLTSLARGHTADASIVLEPTEGQPRSASRGGYRFQITARGRAVHGTVKWLGKDAIQTMRSILDVLAELEKDWNDRRADALFARYPIMRPISVDRIDGGAWQGMVADRCLCAGYLELLPSDNPQQWRTRFAEELMSRLSLRRIPRADIEVATLEQYDGHSTPIAHALCRAAQAAMTLPARQSSSPKWTDWAAFNSGCEAGLRPRLCQTPTLVWGPGSLDQAHAVDEFVDWRQVQSTAADMAAAAAIWCSGRNESL
jgi:acetylornithine deacetylase